jgi:hypothetical protein
MIPGRTPPAGRLGGPVAAVFGGDGDRQVREDLRRFESLDQSDDSGCPVDLDDGSVVPERGGTVDTANTRKAVLTRDDLENDGGSFDEQRRPARIGGARHRPLRR